MFGIIFIGGCIQEKKITSENEILFETMTKSHRVTHKNAGDYVINSQNEWIKFINNTSIFFGVIPEIDFSNNTIIAVDLGVRNTGGYSIEITKVVETDSKVIVSVKESRPSHNAMVTQSFTQPYHVIKIRKITKPIVFKRI